MLVFRHDHPRSHTSHRDAADPVSLIHAIHERRMKAGVAISPDTPSTSISDEVGELVDLLLVMTVYPGELFFISLPFLTLRGTFSRPRRAEVYGALRSQGRRTSRTVS
jgi:hypothetical protein